MNQYACSPGYGTYCYPELSASFINFLHYCSPSSGFYGAGKDNRGRCTDKPSECHPMWTVGAPTSITLPFFTSSALSVATLPLYLALGQAPNNVGLRTRYRKNRWTIKLGQGMFDTANIGKIPDNNWLP